MGKTNHHYYYYIYPLIFSLVFAFAIAAFVFCILAECKKSKLEDVKLDGILCELPGNEAFGLGIAALVCSSISQIIGNLIIFVPPCCPVSKERKSSCQAKRPTIANILLAFSWMSFVVSMLLISTSSSMNRRQPYGKGWVDGECYVVKDGVFVGAAILVLFSLGCTLISAIATLRKRIHVSTDDEKSKDIEFLTPAK